MSSPNKPSAIFDLDGTLIDAFADIAAAVNHGLKHYGLPTHSVEDVRGFVGNGVTKLIDRAAPGHTDEMKDKVMAELMVYYQTHPADHAFTYDGAIAMLEDLRGRGWKLGILSNKPHHVTMLTCDKLGLTSYFDDIVGEHPVNAPRKPDPTALRAQIKRMGRDRAMLAGDGVPDGVVANTVGIPFAACLWGTRIRDELAPNKPFCFAENVPELHRELLKWGDLQSNQ